MRCRDFRTGTTSRCGGSGAVTGRVLPACRKRLSKSYGATALMRLLVMQSRGELQSRCAFGRNQRGEQDDADAEGEAAED